MSMRVVMLGLIGERNRLGGEERLLNVDERLKRMSARPAENLERGRSAFPAKPAPDLIRVGAGRVKENASIKIRAPFRCIGTEKARGRRER